MHMRGSGEGHSVAPSIFWSLLHGEAAGLLNGLRQLVAEQLVRLVGRQIDPVKAGVRLGQVLRGHVGSQVNGEQSRAHRSRGSLQRSESLQWHSRRSRHKLQQAGSHLRAIRLDHLEEITTQFSYHLIMINHRLLDHLD